MEAEEGWETVVTMIGRSLRSPSGKRRRRRPSGGNVLIVEHQGDEILVADPAGRGSTTVTPKDFKESSELGAVRGRSWVGLIGAR